MSTPRLKGHKADLPLKTCQACGRPMSWRKSWAKNWDEVRWCSEACRRAGAARRRSEGAR